MPSSSKCVFIDISIFLLLLAKCVETSKTQNSLHIPAQYLPREKDNRLMSILTNDGREKSEDDSYATGVGKTLYKENDWRLAKNRKKRDQTLENSEATSFTRNEDEGKMKCFNRTFKNELSKRILAMENRKEVKEVEEKRKNKRLAGVVRKSRQSAKVWDQWGKWSGCSVSCGVGKLTRWRHCVSGSCSVGEKKAQIKTCTFASC